MTALSSKTKAFRIAIDLGATSGRIMLGGTDGTQREIARFNTPMLHQERGIFWDFPTLFRSILDGLKTLTKDDGPFLSLSCDSWAQDFGLLDKDGRLLDLPYSYRDTSCDIHSNCRLALIQERRPDLYEKATRLLHIADLVHYYLCGEIRPNYSLVAISRLPMNHPLLAPLADGEIIGTVNHPELPCLAGVPVVSGAGHDTAAAYMSSAPAFGELFVSLGTWYMAATPWKEEPVLTAPFGPLPLPFHKWARTCGGMGMWPFQQCVKLWKERNTFTDYATLSREAQAVRAEGILSAQDKSLFSPENMEMAIWNQLGYQATPPQITRLLFEGLAREVGRVRTLFGVTFTKVIAAGGPSVNPYLMNLIQAQLPCPLVIGKQEATVAGNLDVQRIVIPE